MKSKNIINLILNQIESLSSKRRYLVWEKNRKNSSKGYNLNKDQISLVRNFYKRYHKVSMYSHCFYTHKTGNFSEKYIPDALWYGYIEPFYNPRSLAKAMDSKTLYSRLFPHSIENKLGLEHPLNIAAKINGYWLSGEYEPISISDILEVSKQHQHIFIKQAEDSAGGHGVSHFKMPGDERNFQDALKKISCNAVVQVGLKQHSIMASLNPSSVNTIRILSHITKNGEVKIRSVVVRMGRNGTYVDNASSGGVTVGVNEFGKLREFGYDVEGISYSEHPDTHVKFSDVLIPNYDELLSTIKKECWKLPQFRLLSWDIAIDETGQPILIEVNMHSGQLDFHQLNNGPVFGDDTKEILEEVFGSFLGN